MSRSSSRRQAGALFLVRTAGGASPARTSSTPGLTPRRHPVGTSTPPGHMPGFETERCNRSGRVTAVRRAEPLAPASEPLQTAHAVVSAIPAIAEALPTPFAGSTSRPVPMRSGVGRDRKRMRG